MDLERDADELAALGMVFSGIAILLFGTVAAFIFNVEFNSENLLLIGNALLLPASGYLFGKSKPK